jgi:ureidoglycolate hydrolase
LKTIIAKPLNAKDFAPFGDVLEIPKEPGRVYCQGLLERVQAFLADDEEFVSVPSFRVMRG